MVSSGLQWHSFLILPSLLSLCFPAFPLRPSRTPLPLPSPPPPALQPPLRPSFLSSFHQSLVPLPPPSLQFSASFLLPCFFLAPQSFFFSRPLTFTLSLQPSLICSFAASRPDSFLPFPPSPLLQTQRVRKFLRRDASVRELFVVERRCHAKNNRSNARAIAPI